MTEAFVLPEFVLDKLDQEVRVGDTILYAITQGSSSAYLRKAVVLEILPPANEWQYNQEPRLRVQPEKSTFPSSTTKPKPVLIHAVKNEYARRIVKI